MMSACSGPAGRIAGAHPSMCTTKCCLASVVVVRPAFCRRFRKPQVYRPGQPFAPMPRMLLLLLLPCSAATRASTCLGATRELKGQRAHVCLSACRRVSTQASRRLCAHARAGTAHSRVDAC